ncbi:MAG TPA: hypothetical protein VFS21_05675 [Roseiflexaceae bacterium]|nr:hypothetical protein [Roseiflexaceae bacterium]
MLKFFDRRRRAPLLVVLWCLALLLTTAPLAVYGAPLLSDDFEDGNATGWTTSGGSWSVASDGTQVYRQGGTSADARALAGSTAWADQIVEARVKPISFNGSNRFVAVLARAQSSTSYYYLALRSNNTVELKKLVSGSGTTLASAPFTVATGAWYTLRLEVQGTTLRGFVNGAQLVSASDTRFASGRAGLATFYASASFDDVLVTAPGTAPTATATRTATPGSPTATRTATATPTRTATPTITPTPPPSDGRIFPGAQGFGVDSPAGRGGQILRVTNLNASGAGSLRAALETAGPRIIIFEVGGVIDLNQTKLTLNQPFVTIAGQTAPSPGITLIRGGFEIRTHDVLIKHIRFRMGDAGATSGFEPDVTTYGPEAYNIVIDHCSFSWGVDENLSVSGPRFDGPNGTSRRVTLSNNIIAEGLYDSIHSKGVHSMGTLIHDYVTDVAVIGNLYAHNYERNPWFKGFATGVIVNNVVYNPGKWPMRLGPVLSEWTSSGITPEPPRVSVVGNYMRYGVNTPAGIGMLGTNSIGSAYLEDNIALDRAGAAVPLTFGGVTILGSQPSWPAGLVALPASQVAEHVAAHAGARPRDRDSADARIVADFLAGRGQFVNSQTEVGGYPNPPMTTRPLTVPTSDIDGWLHSFSLALE